MEGLVTSSAHFPDGFEELMRVAGALLGGEPVQSHTSTTIQREAVLADIFQTLPAPGYPEHPERVESLLTPACLLALLKPEVVIGFDLWLDHSAPLRRAVYFSGQSQVAPLVLEDEENVVLEGCFHYACSILVSHCAIRKRVLG